MSEMPTTKALFGYDVIGSSKTDDDQLEEVRQAAGALVEQALQLAGVDRDGRVNHSPTGDGSLAAYPERCLPALIDATYFLHGLLYQRNRKVLPQLRLRVAVHTGPLRVTDADNFQRPTIELARLLDAAPLKAIGRSLLANERPVTVLTAVSEQAFKVAVRSGETERLLPHDFRELAIVNKEFDQTCWAWIPGADPQAYSTSPASDVPAAPAGPSPQGSQVINGGVTGTGIANNQSGHNVTNVFSGHRP